MTTTRTGGASRDAYAQDPESVLIDRLWAGDPFAFEELLRVYGPIIRGVARRFFGDGPDGDDAIQEASISAYRGLKSFAANARLGTWLYRITYNVCLMKLRHRKRRRFVSLDEAFGPGGALAITPRDEDGPGREEEIAHVRSCISALPEPYQAVIRPRDLEELSTEGTAARLGTNGPVVKTRLHRARKALKSLLAPVYGEGTAD